MARASLPGLSVVVTGRTTTSFLAGMPDAMLCVVEPLLQGSVVKQLVVYYCVFQRQLVALFTLFPFDISIAEKEVI